MIKYYVLTVVHSSKPMLVGTADLTLVMIVVV